RRGHPARPGTEGRGAAAARDATEPCRRFDVGRSRGDRFRPHLRRVGAHPHDGALAAGLLELGDGEVERLLALLGEPGGFGAGGHYGRPRHGFGASWVEARIYTEAAISAIRGETRPPGAPTCRPSTRYNRSDRRPTAGRSDPPRPAPPSPAPAAWRP